MASGFVLRELNQWWPGGDEQQAAPQRDFLSSDVESFPVTDIHDVPVAPGVTSDDWGQARIPSIHRNN
jgi:hypothetical protein